MAEVTLAAVPARADLIERLRPRLGELIPHFSPIAENLLGDDVRIDFVGIEPDGRVVLVLVDAPGEDLELVGRAIAQRAWVEPRVADWIQLAPNLGARRGAGVRVVLLCAAPSRQTEAAVAALGPDTVELARYRCLRNGSELEILLERCRPGVSQTTPRATAAPAPPTPPGVRAPVEPSDAEIPPFRTGLTEQDLALTPAEQRSLE